MKRPSHVETEDLVLARITDLLLKQGKSQKNLMEYLEMEKSGYTSWKSGKSKSYRRYIHEIADYLEVSPNYLLAGENDSDEEELIRRYRKMDKEKRQKLLSIARTI